jgi:hypothetical protein
MKKAYLIITTAIIIVAVVLLFTSPMRETITPEYKTVNSYVPDPAEYQLVIVDDSIIISDFGRHVKTIHLSSTGELENVLIQDNE